MITQYGLVWFTGAYSCWRYLLYNIWLECKKSYSSSKSFVRGDRATAGVEVAVGNWMISNLFSQISDQLWFPDILSNQFFCGYEHIRPIILTQIASQWSCVILIIIHLLVSVWWNPFHNVCWTSQKFREINAIYIPLSFKTQIII